MPGEFTNADWIRLIAALGTWAAVVTALWLARRDRRVKLRVTAGQRMVVSSGGPNLVSIFVTNEAQRAVTVNAVGYRPPGRWSKTGAFLVLPDPDYSSGKLPTKLTDGDGAFYSIELEKFDSQVVDRIARDHLTGCCPRLKARSIKVFAETSTGRFEARLEGGLRDRFVRKALELKHGEHSTEDV